MNLNILLAKKPKGGGITIKFQLPHHVARALNLPKSRSTSCGAKSSASRIFVGVGFEF